MKMSGNRPPMMVPAKGIYMNKDLERNSSYFQLPLKLIEVTYPTFLEKKRFKKYVL